MRCPKCGNTGCWVCDCKAICVCGHKFVVLPPAVKRAFAASRAFIKRMTRYGFRAEDYALFKRAVQAMHAVDGVGLDRNFKWKHIARAEGKEVKT